MILLKKEKAYIIHFFGKFLPKVVFPVANATGKTSGPLSHDGGGVMRGGVSFPVGRVPKRISVENSKSHLKKENVIWNYFLENS